MITEKQKEKARIFSAMHKENKMFILPNAWDVAMLLQKPVRIAFLSPEQ